MIKSKDTMQDYSSLVSNLDSIKKDGFTNDGERMKALAAAYALVARLETPWEFVARLCMGQVRSSDSHLGSSNVQLTNNMFLILAGSRRRLKSRHGSEVVWDVA